MSPCALTTMEEQEIARINFYNNNYFQSRLHCFLFTMEKKWGRNELSILKDLRGSYRETVPARSKKDYQHSEKSQQQAEKSYVACEPQAAHRAET